jgi:hypothetical protein
MDESAYAWGALKTLPESVREKKGTQLELIASVCGFTIEKALDTGQPGAALNNTSFTLVYRPTGA